MADQERPLPKPPKQAFGFQKPAAEPSSQELLADRMAAAAAEGRLDEFLKKEMPDSEHAQALAKMMMGMTGMMPTSGGVPASMPRQNMGPPASEKDAATESVPEDVFKAVQGGDMKGLMDLLRREQKRRALGGQTAEAVPSAEPAAQAVIDKELIDALVRIASDNSVTLDWVILRAIKVYVEEYRKTGKL